MRLPAILAITAVISTGCALTQDEPPGLEGTRWQLTSVSGRTLTLPDQETVALGFHDSRVYFRACNALSGRYTQVRNHIAVPKGFIGTRMACEKNILMIDAAATELFQRGVTVHVSGDSLTLEGGSEKWSFRRLPGIQLEPTTTAANEKAEDLQPN